MGRQIMIHSRTKYPGRGLASLLTIPITTPMAYRGRKCSVIQLYTWNIHRVFA